MGYITEGESRFFVTDIPRAVQWAVCGIFFA